MRIVLAVDQSKNSEQAIDFLATQRFNLPIDLDLVSILTPFSTVVSLDGGGGMPMVAVDDPGGLLADEKKFVQERLAKTKERLKGLCREINCHVKVGSPAAEITRLANERNADLVVMGAIGHSAIARMLLGSVSDYVATHANGNALIIRPARPGKSNASPRNVLVAVSAAHSDLHLLNQIKTYDLPQTTTIHLVHVMQTFTFFRQEIVKPNAEIWQQIRQTVTQHLSILHDATEKWGLASQTKILEAPHVGEALTEYADQNECDWVLACDQQRGLLDRAILGSTSRFLLRHVHGSVLIVRAPNQ